jgi:hypothetical protein
MNIPDLISESLETIFGSKDFDADADTGSGNLFNPGSGMEKIRIRNKHSASATLIAIHDRHIAEKSSRAAPFLQGGIVDVGAQGHPLQALVVLVGAVKMGVAVWSPHQRQ